MIGWIVSRELEEDAPDKLPPGRRIYQDRDYRVSIYVPRGPRGVISRVHLWLLGILVAARRPWKIGRSGEELLAISNGITFYSSSSSRLVVHVRVANVIARLRIRSALVKKLGRVKFLVRVSNPYSYIYNNLLKEGYRDA
jgi:hypothetical protein